MPRRTLAWILSLTAVAGAVSGCGAAGDADVAGVSIERTQSRSTATATTVAEPTAPAGVVVVRFDAGAGWTVILEGAGTEHRLALEGGVATFADVAAGGYSLSAESVPDGPQATDSNSVTLIPPGSLLRLGAVTVAGGARVVVDCTADGTCTGVD